MTLQPLFKRIENINKMESSKDKYLMLGCIKETVEAVDTSIWDDYSAFDDEDKVLWQQIKEALK